MKTDFLKNKKIWIAVCAIVLVTVLTIGIFTLSRYNSLETTDATVELEEFTAVARMTYIPDGETERQEITLTSNGNENLDYIELTLKEFETLQMNIEYTGQAKTYCRFRLDCSWMRETSALRQNEETGQMEEYYYTELIPHKYPTYTYPDYTEGEGNVYNNVERDGWFYFTDILESEDGTAKTYTAIESIQKGSDFIDPITEGDRSERVQISVTIDCVQYNRVSALWKMTSLPWWNT